MKDHYPEWCITREYRINFEVEVSQSELSEKFAYIPIQCRELDWKSFLPPGPDKADFNSLAVVRYDIDTGRPFVFDEEAEKEKRFIIPHRFEHEHKPFALPFYSEDRGSLTWLAPFLPARQYYSVYFDLKRKGNDLCGYQGLIGDGDIFTQRKGIMCVHGNSRPVLYGKKLFGKKGLVVASSYKTGIYFFEETGLSGSGPNFVNRGRLKDIDGKVIWGIPTFHDFKGRGILDLVVGRNDGTVYRYNNLGSNDNPIFSRPEPLKEINGSPVDLKKYLRDKNIIVRLTDGAVNPRYPEMPVVQVHGGENHIYTTPEFVDWSNTGRYDLLIGTKGGFLLHFEYTASGYREGRFLKDEKGEMISNEISAFPAVVSRNENGRQDLILGSYHGFLYYLKNIGMDDGVPIFQNKGKIPVEKETGCSFPMFSGNNLFVGNSRGEVKSYTVSGTAENGVPVFTGGKYILINNAWIGHQMPVARYTDMDGDGKKDLLSGDIQGGVFLYRNLGTNRNPVFSKRYWLNAENCPIKIEGGPDPIESDDGYSKPVTTDISGDGKADILVGSGLGRIFFYRNLGPDKEGIPRFAKGVVLKDNQGNEIRCHHMSAVEVADWDGDGIPDIIVSGQKDIHKLKSDDPDRESQVRWYRGLGRDKTGNLLFAPYIPLEAEGDKEFQYRPIPPAVGEWEKKKVLYIGNNIFRQVNKNIPEQVEFLGTLPPRLIHAREGFIGAYSTFSSLGENDPVIVNASCISSIFAFRRSFVLNRGYLKAGFRLTALQKAEGSFQKKLNLSIDQPPLRIPFPERTITKEHSIPFIPDIPKPGSKLNLDFWRTIPTYTDFQDEDGKTLSVEQKIELKMACTQDALLIFAEFWEPVMNRLICNVDHNNGPVDNDDNISVFLNPGIENQVYYCWLINPLGCYKEFNIKQATGEPLGPWQAGGTEKVDIKTRIKNNSYLLQMYIPLKKLGIIPQQKTSWLFDVRRRRKIYAGNIRAREQQFTGFFLWSGNREGWVKLRLAEALS